MSPFRYMFKQAGVRHPVGYAIGLLAASVIVCMLATIAICTRITDHAIREAERRQCETIQADVDGYLEVPPVTRAGIKQLETKQERLKSLGCPVAKD